MNAHKDADERTEEDKQQDKEFEEVHQGVTKRGMITVTPKTVFVCGHL